MEHLLDKLSRRADARFERTCSASVCSISSGGGSNHTTATTTTSNIPEWFEADSLDLMDRARNESMQGYEAFDGQRVADITGLQRNSRDNLGAMTEPGEVGQASSNFSSMYGNTPSQYDALNYNPGQWTDPGVRDRYMSPYMQGVVDVQKQAAIQDSMVADMGIDYEADRAGAFGGDRHAIREAENTADLNDRLNEIQLTGLQSAYDQGANQYNTDRDAMTQATQMNEQSSQFAADYAQQGAQNDILISQSLADIGNLRQSMGIDLANAQEGAGALDAAHQQQLLDRDYEDFANARDYERQNIAFLNSILRGGTVPTSQESIAYSPGGNNWNALAGMGIAGLGSGMLGGNTTTTSGS